MDSKRKNINPRNAIPEFKQMVENSDDTKGIKEAVKQMGSIIRTVVTDSLGDSGYERALEHLHVMRGQMIAMEEPNLYNAFIGDFKKRLLQGEFNGDRRELWYKMKGTRLGLIDSTISESSEVTSEEATEVSDATDSELFLSVTVTNGIAVFGKKLLSSGVVRGADFLYTTCHTAGQYHISQVLGQRGSVHHISYLYDIKKHISANPPRWLIQKLAHPSSLQHLKYANFCDNHLPPSPPNASRFGLVNSGKFLCGM